MKEYNFEYKLSPHKMLKKAESLFNEINNDRESLKLYIQIDGKTIVIPHGSEIKFGYCEIISRGEKWTTIRNIN